MTAALIIGGILVVLSIVFLVLSNKAADTITAIRHAEWTRPNDLAELSAAVSGDLGSSGSFRHGAKVKGLARAEKPLSAEFSQSACVYYRTRVVRKYEETVQSTDSNGNKTTSTRQGSETISQNEQEIPFVLDAGESGTLAINGLGARWITVKSMERFEPGDAAGGMLKIGNFSLSLKGLAGGKRTLGYTYIEEIIPLEREIFVLGEVSDASGKLTLMKPEDGKSPLIISTKSETEILKSEGAAQKGFLVGAVISLIAGLGSAVYGLFFAS